MKKEEIVKLFPIETERLIVRVATIDDVDLIQAAKESCDADILRRWMSWSSDEGMSMQGTIDFLTMANSADNKTNVALLAVDKTTGGHVVSTGLDAEDGDFQVISTGWWLSQGHEGKGLAYEAMRGLLDVMAAQTDSQKMTASHYEGNVRSGNLMRRLGFIHTQTHLKNHRSHLTGEMLDVYDFELELQK